MIKIIVIIRIQMKAYLAMFRLDLLEQGIVGGILCHLKLHRIRAISEGEVNPEPMAAHCSGGVAKLVQTIKSINQQQQGKHQFFN